MNDEQAVLRANQAKQALDVVDPIFAAMLEKAMKDTLEAEAPEDVVRHQLYARAIQKARKTITDHILAGDVVKTLAAKH